MPTTKVTARDVKGSLDRGEDTIVLNVLAEEQFEQEHIPRSHNIPGDHPSFVQEVERLAGRKDRRIIVHCSSVQCRASGDAAERLTRAGFTSVSHFPGGIAEWKQAGYSLEGTVPAGRT